MHRYYALFILLLQVVPQAYNCEHMKTKAWGDNYFAVRIPFRKNGGGMHLNQYTISMYVKFRKVQEFDRVRYLPKTLSSDIFNLISRADP